MPSTAKPRITIKSVKFSSLSPLLQLLKAPNIKIQIISLESISLLLETLHNHHIHYKLLHASTTYSKDVVNIIYEDRDLPSTGQYIIYTKRYNPNYIPLIFSPTESEIKLYLHGRYKHFEKLAKFHFKTKTLTQIIDTEQNTAHKHAELNYLESIVLFTLLSYSKYDEIVREIEKIDSQMDNSFEILMGLNSLVNNRFIVKKNDKYKIIASRETVAEVCKKIGYDINLLK